jgi:hypothetical protein
MNRIGEMGVLCILGIPSAFGLWWRTVGLQEEMPRSRHDLWLTTKHESGLPAREPRPYGQLLEKLFWEGLARA